MCRSALIADSETDVICHPYLIWVISTGSAVICLRLVSGRSAGAQSARHSGQMATFPFPALPKEQRTCTGEPRHVAVLPLMTTHNISSKANKP